ncbi:MAG TPA: hypothetical protein VI462_03890 [Acidimicrobiia bacterium]
MSTQLRLVEPPATAPSRPAARRAPTTGARRRGRAVPRRARRAVHWADDWHLDANLRRVGRAGVAAARASLGKATEGSLRQAS